MLPCKQRSRCNFRRIAVSRLLPPPPTAWRGLRTPPLPPGARLSRERPPPSSVRPQVRAAGHRPTGRWGGTPWLDVQPDHPLPRWLFGGLGGAAKRGVHPQWHSARQYSFGILFKTWLLFPPGPQSHQTCKNGISKFPPTKKNLCLVSVPDLSLVRIGIFFVYHLCIGVHRPKIFCVSVCIVDTHLGEIWSETPWQGESSLNQQPTEEALKLLPDMADEL